MIHFGAEKRVQASDRSFGFRSSCEVTVQTLHQRKTLLLLFAVAACSATGCSAQKRSAQPNSPSATAKGDDHTWHLKREERSAPLTDWQTHQSRTFKMMSMLLPVGWQLDVRPGPNFATIDCADTSGRIIVSAASADKSMGILVLPSNASMSSDNEAFLQQKQNVMRNFKGAFNCSVEQPMPLSVDLKENATKLVPGAQIVGQLEPVPGLSDEVPNLVATANQRGDSHITAEAGRLRLTGTLQGKPVEMYLVALAVHRTMPAPGGGTVTYNDLPLAALIYAPPGQLDRNQKMLMTVLASVQIDPEWTRNAQYFVAELEGKINGAYAAVNRIHQQMAQDNANAAAQQAAIRSGAANYRSQVMSSVAQSRSAALDHSSQQFALYMGDQAIYKDPSTGQRVQMSSGYDHVWASSTGNSNEYIMTDSASYDPNGQVGSSGWKQMEVEH
jgi:hypothetical protein